MGVGSQTLPAYARPEYLASGIPASGRSPKDGPRHPVTETRAL